MWASNTRNNTFRLTVKTIEGTAISYLLSQCSTSANQTNSTCSEVDSLDSISQNNPIGTLSVVDPDAGSSYTLTVSIEGGTDSIEYSQYWVRLAWEQEAS